jgi:hypothetical protein
VVNRILGGSDGGKEKNGKYYVMPGLHGKEIKQISCR